MKAVVHERYGSPDVLHLTEVPRPVPADDEILIRIRAVSINGSDREGLIGKPAYARMGGLLRPRHRILGSDIAGCVESVGRNHPEFKPGDEVFGELPGYGGGFAEYVCTSGRTLMRKPAGLTFAQAAAIPQGGVIALQGIREKGRVQAGQKVLINGAGGSAGSFAIQLARLHGADVTAVDHASKLDFMRSLGAHHVLDYQKEDFTARENQYDLILDLIAHRSVFASQRALRRDGTYFFVGGSTTVIFPILFLGPWIRRARRRNVRLLVVPQNRKDLIAITALCEAGAVVPAIDREYPLSETAEAMRYVADGLARGKVVITVESSEEG
jgi:NADPH:quinone reductase-like Zn-dependent oxidoreductase